MIRVNAKFCAALSVLAIAYLITYERVFAQTQPACSAPAGEKIVGYTFEYATGATFAEDVNAVHAAIGAYTKSTTTQVPSKLSSALEVFGYAPEDISVLIPSDECESRATFYVTVFKYKSSPCGFAETDIMFGVKGFKRAIAQDLDLGCRGQHGNWMRTYTVPSSNHLPATLLNRISN